MRRSKTEYLPVGRIQDARELGLQGETVKKVETFKYLGSVLSVDESCEEEVRKGIRAGWLSWRRVSGVLCNRKQSARVKGRIYKSVVRPALMYGMETVAATDSQVKKLEVAELKMVRWTTSVTRKDKIRNEYIRGTAKIARLDEKLRGARLRHVGRRMLELGVPGKRRRGRPKRRWMDVIREDMEKAGAQSAGAWKF